MQEYDDALLEPLALDGMVLPLLRLTLEPEPPNMNIKVGDQAYHYERSFPIKGHSASMPPFVMEQISAGKQPLVVERPTRYYVYLPA